MSSKTEKWNVKINVTVDGFKHNCDLTSSENGVLSMLATMRNQFESFNTKVLTDIQFTELFILYHCILDNKLTEFKGNFVQIIKL